MNDDDDAGDGPTADFLNFAFDFDGDRLERNAERQARLDSIATTFSDSGIDSGAIRTDVCICAAPSPSTHPATGHTTVSSTMTKKQRKPTTWSSVKRRPRAAEPAPTSGNKDAGVPVGSDEDAIGLPSEAEGAGNLVPLVGLRVTLDGVRPVDPKHVARLGESLRNVGKLLTPLVVDIDGEVVDGRHRFAFLTSRNVASACDALCPGGLVPVVRLDYRAADDPARAILDALLIAQVSRRLTAQELGEAIKRMVTIHGKPRRGRPATGAEAVYGLIAGALGISTRTVARHHHKAVNPQPDKAVSTNSRLLTRARDSLVKALVVLEPGEQAVVQPVLLLLDERLGGSTRRIE